MIFYFSATGNSKYVAKKIAAETSDVVYSITEVMQSEKYSYSTKPGERIGFVIPVYYYGVPAIVEEFIKKMEITDRYNSQHYIFTVLTCGGSTGNAGKMLSKLLDSRNIEVTSRFSVKMVDNYVILYDLPKEEEINEIMLRADVSINKICKKIKAGVVGDFDKIKGVLPGIVTPIIYSAYKHGRKTEKFYVEDHCKSCGLCTIACPENAIRMTGIGPRMRPVWVADKCSQCLACLHRCPVSAIQYGKKTSKHGRFYNKEAEK
ncbi:MAG: 4Fe-4S dicluster domain-containing protein [Ruminococcaceae bacterium]|nr:4Fe-4S dicluster domain-containing protein [Oscillospiraceae bacterium]